MKCIWTACWNVRTIITFPLLRDAGRKGVCVGFWRQLTSLHFNVVNNEVLWWCSLEAHLMLPELWAGDLFDQFWFNPFTENPYPSVTLGRKSYTDPVVVNILGWWLSNTIELLPLWDIHNENWLHQRSERVNRHIIDLSLLIQPAVAKVWDWR